MSRSLSLLLLPLLALGSIAARKADDPKHENHFRTDGSVPSADGLGLALTKAEAQQEFVAVDGKLSNTSADKIFVLKKGEASFVLPQGTFSTKAGGLFGGTVWIPPGESRSVGFKAEGAGFHVDAFTLKPAGIYVASNTGTAVKTPDFGLPASNNDFTAGSYSCHLDGLKKETDETSVKFACTYNGTGVGILEPRRIGVKTESGQEYANEAKKNGRELLLTGDTAKFNAVFHVTEVDMQFAKLTVLFRDALTESTLSAVPLADWKFVLDPEATAKAND